MSIATREFQINDYLTVKLENDKTNIYVNGEYFRHCKFLLLEIPTGDQYATEEIESIDDAAEKLDRSLEYQENKYLIHPEVEFWGHSSNLQVWYENNYDTRLLHSNLSFPLIKKLTEVGDLTAKKVFKDEIAIRFLNGSLQTKYYLYREGYLDILNENEYECLINEYYHKLEFFDSFNVKNKENGLFLTLKLEKMKREDLDYTFEEIYYSLKEKCGLEEFEFWYQIGIWAKTHVKRKFAINAFKRSLKLNSKRIATMYQLGCLFEDEYRYRKAIKVFKKALKIDPFHYDILYALGSLYHDISRCKKAIKVINNALEFYSNDPELNYLLGWVYEEKGEYQIALDKYMEALSKNKDDPLILKNIAIIYRKLKNYEWAVLTYKTILILYPNSSLALEGLCETLIEKGELSKAIKFCKRAIRCNKWNHSNWIRLGRIYYSNGAYEEAIELYKKALEIFPDDTEILYNLRLAYVKVGRNDLAFCTLVSEVFISTIKH